MQITKHTPTKPFDWLNENSRKFLAAGYIGEGLSAEDRITDIAKRAEEILKALPQNIYNDALVELTKFVFSRSN